MSEEKKVLKEIRLVLNRFHKFAEYDCTEFMQALTDISVILDEEDI